ncbi:MAG: long-chain-acyl-CoA synthetase [Hydrocarboniphaga sp.]|uniref:long-chain-acyl-CoA synthetase n=1 Tax=Hydrocarboniphaga sp. TaxID=2033016 RepID=UPI00261DC5D0|nr:long-chain-acyl-CoA synthetase [Hydrocarboniphaga sp.]MDB5971918.1 long-chain-acyl-CoA synthetase [Hydrocarboniphaga sp.]
MSTSGDPAAERGTDRIRLIDMLASGARMLPELPAVLRGLVRLVTLHHDARGSIGALIANHARLRPNALALMFEGRRWSYAEFNTQANRVASVLRAQGIGPGDAVAILMENRAEVLICVAAVLKLGAIAGMINHQQRGDALTHSLKLTKARLVIVGEECREAFASTRYVPESGEPLSVFWDGDSAAPEDFIALRPLLGQASVENPPVTARIQLKSPAFYIFTSGTTGLPKASVMSHFRWIRGMAGMAEAAVRLRQDDILYCCLPLYHNNALTVSWGAVLARGAGLAVSRKFSASRFWDEIRASGSTSFCYIGELCRYLLNRPASDQDREHKLRVIVGNGLRPEIWDSFQQRFGIERICEFYSASESNLAFVNAWNMPRTAGYCPLSYAIVRFDADAEAPVRDARNHLLRVEAGGVGLLIGEVTRSAPFDGYTDAKASETKLLRKVFKDGDCWFNTGDLVRDQGWHHIQFVDRVGDTFRWKGENVATTEVEAALCTSSGVAEAVVYGVQLPGIEGRAGMASLSVSGQDFDGAALAQWLHRCLPPYAVPLFLRLRRDQETTSTFKHRKVDLKREAYDPARVTDPLYVLQDGAYVPLTAECYAGLQRGDWRF